MTSSDQIVGIIALILIVFGVICNMAAFSIFIFSKQINTIPSMRYLAFISITDTLSLFVWNLNHFLGPNLNAPPIETWSIFNCKFLPFLQYSSLQCSGLLYSILSVDRYFSVFSLPGSFFSKLPFGTIKNATLWSLGIIATIYTVNLHLIILMGYYGPTNGSNTTGVICFKSAVYPNGNMSPMWDYANMVIYNFFPFIIMLIFNSLLIQKTFNLHAKRQDARDSAQYISANRRKERLTISLVVITFAFIILTLPSTILFSFLLETLKNSNARWTLQFVDCLA
jgi:hypothetical protein